MRSSDHFTMSIPVEHRFPLLDYRLVEFGLRLPISYMFSATAGPNTSCASHATVPAGQVCGAVKKWGFSSLRPPLFSSQCRRSLDLCWRIYTGVFRPAGKQELQRIAGTGPGIAVAPDLNGHMAEAQRQGWDMNHRLCGGLFSLPFRKRYPQPDHRLDRPGHEVLIFSNARSSERDMHDDIRKYDLLKKTYYLNDRPGGAQRFLCAFFLIFAFIHRNPKAVLNSLNVFKYGKETLSLTYFYKVMLFLGVGRIDVILCHYGPNGDFAALLKDMGLTPKLITMFHGYDIRRGIEQGGAVYQRLFEEGDAFLSISDYNRTHLLAFGAPPEKIHDHPVGIDLGRYVFAERKSSGPIKILSVGRLVKEKGHAYGLRAIQQLLRRLPSVDIVGLTRMDIHH